MIEEGAAEPLPVSLPARVVSPAAGMAVGVGFGVEKRPALAPVAVSIPEPVPEETVTVTVERPPPTTIQEEKDRDRDREEGERVVPLARDDIRSRFVMQQLARHHVTAQPPPKAQPAQSGGQGGHNHNHNHTHPPGHGHGHHRPPHAPPYPYSHLVASHPAPHHQASMPPSAAMHLVHSQQQHTRHSNNSNSDNNGNHHSIGSIGIEEASLSHSYPQQPAGHTVIMQRLQQLESAANHANNNNAGGGGGVSVWERETISPRRGYVSRRRASFSHPRSPDRDAIREGRPTVVRFPPVVVYEGANGSSTSNHTHRQGQDRQQEGN
mmetsp:Transcript_28178/g.81165  ORF Transcript_28178/g.81165 Transcript_28178/m.81165 type:complete len:323 (+) Transcript_28178:1-969(+)